jgi:hypothetical protein
MSSRLIVAKRENATKIDFQKLFRNRASASPIEPPARAVGEDAPAQRAARQIVDPAQISKHLSGRRCRFIAARCAV